MGMAGPLEELVLVPAAEMALQLQWSAPEWDTRLPPLEAHPGIDAMVMKHVRDRPGTPPPPGFYLPLLYL